MLVLIDCYGCEHKKTMDCHLSCAHKDAPIRSRRTNADRIRAMTDEELAVFLWDVDHNGLAEFCNKNPCPPNAHCAGCMLEWLEKEVEDGGTD